MTDQTPRPPSLEEDLQKGQFLLDLTPLIMKGGAEAWAEAQRLADDFERRFPGEIERMADRLTRRRLGLSARTH